MRTLVLLLVGCGRVAFEPLARSGDGGTDVADGSATTACQTFGAWSAPVELASLTSAGDDWEPALHPSGSPMVFNRDGIGLFAAASASPTTFAAPMQIPWSDGTEAGPTWTSDGTQLYFVRSGGPVFELWVSTFDGATFASPAVVIDSELQMNDVLAPAIRSDGLELYWCTGTPTAEIYRAERPTTTSMWSVTGVEAALTLAGGQSGWPSLSTDGLTLYIETISAAGPKIYVSERAVTSDRFGPPVILSDLGVPTSDDAGDPYVSHDDTRLFMAYQPQSMATLFDIYVSSRVCLD